jgi:hypothetical protein
MNFRTEIMKPMLLIVAAIVAFGSIVARADGIDTSICSASQSEPM